MGDIEEKSKHWVSDLPKYVAGVACVLIAAYTITFWGLPFNEKPDAWGQFGDYIGGLLNPLVSALTLYVAISVWKLQKEELKETRRAMDEQAKTAEQQRQEQRFFDLFDIYQRTVDEIVFSQNSKKSALVYATQEEVNKRRLQAVGEFISTIKNNDEYKNSNKKNLYVDTWHEIETQKNILRIKNFYHLGSFSSFTNYFRVIHNILKNADTLLPDDHYRYIKLFRAQLTAGELQAIGLNMWLSEEGKKMIPLAEKYGLLKHLPHDSNTQLRVIFEVMFPPAVFGRTFMKAQSETTPTTEETQHQ